jgi:hypothetical protein
MSHQLVPDIEPLPVLKFSTALPSALPAAA